MSYGLQLNCPHGLSEGACDYPHCVNECYRGIMDARGKSMGWGDRAQIEELRVEEERLRIANDRLTTTNQRLERRLRKAFIAGWNTGFYDNQDHPMTPNAEAAWDEYLRRTDEDGN